MAIVSTVRHFAIVGVLVSSVACSKKTPDAAKASPAVATAPPAAVNAAESIGGDGKLSPNDPKHGTRKLKGLDAPVHVDGKQVAVLRFGEMPSIEPIVLEGGAKRFRLSDYLQGVGVDVSTIQSVHLHGNNDRIASVEGSELRKNKDRFVFGYVSGDTGTPHQKWDTGGLKNEFSIHEIRRVSVFVKKPAAPISKEKQCHVSPSGDCTDAIPYSDGVVAKGTRVYLDGKMIGFVKRRQITDEMRVEGDRAADASDAKFSLAKLALGMGVDAAAVRSIELVAGDDVVARASGEQFASLASETYFTLPKHQHGKVRVHVPAVLQASAPGVAGRDALVSAVLLFRNTAPVGRELVSISEDTDLSVQLAAVDDAHGKPGQGPL